VAITYPITCLLPSLRGLLKANRGNLIHLYPHLLCLSLHLTFSFNLIFFYFSSQFYLRYTYCTSSHRLICNPSTSTHLPLVIALKVYTKLCYNWN
jgi:hypothetical protein